jgi:hypothetical protein
MRTHNIAAYITTVGVAIEKQNCRHIKVPRPGVESRQGVRQERQAIMSDPEPRTIPESLAETLRRHMWRVIAIHEWASARGVAPDELVAARAELGLSEPPATRALLNDPATLVLLRAVAIEIDRVAMELRAEWRGELVQPTAPPAPVRRRLTRKQRALQAEIDATVAAALNAPYQAEAS